VRKLATPFILLGLAVVLMGAGVAASVPANAAGPEILTDSGLTLQLTSSMPGVTFSGNTLVCPVTLVTTSSGENLAACEFTISSTGTVAPSAVAVTMTASGITTAQVAAHKFAIAPQPGPLVYLGTTSQTIYMFTGADLPATVNPGVAWGTNAGTALDNSDMGATIVVTYTVVAESLEGVTATPTVAPTKTPFQSFLGATGAPGNALTPPPTSAARNSSNGGSTPLFALLLCLILAGFALAATEFRRRSVRR
jgi:hypothetical protein